MQYAGVSTLRHIYQQRSLVPMSDSPSIPKRTCTKCKQSFPATLENFYPQKAGKYGLGSWCKTCHRGINKANSRVWYQENKEHVSEYGKQYRADNAEHIADYNFQYYWNNVERERKRTLESNKRHLPRVHKNKRDYYHNHINEIR